MVLYEIVVLQFEGRETIAGMVSLMELLTDVLLLREVAVISATATALITRQRMAT